MTFALSERRFSFTVDEAKELIDDYCFGETRTYPHPPRQAYGRPSAPWSRARWGYRSYDCQRGPGEGIDVVDIVAPVLLNVTHGFGVALVSDLLAVAPAVNEVVAQIPADVRFWTLTDEEIADPVGGSPSWLLHRAWYLIESVPHCDVTNTHKILHHAWPHLFPLIDRRTGPCLGENRWRTVHRDLSDHRDEFEELEAWFAGLAGTRGGVPLTRLRLHDILLWRAVVRSDAAAE